MSGFQRRVCAHRREPTAFYYKLSCRNRRLVELGLKAGAADRLTNKPGQKARAQELAAKTIDSMMDPAAPLEERAQRRRRLTKGPSEFREDRVDLPKAKTK
jgi:hypothetical protein